MGRQIGEGIYMGWDYSNPKLKLIGRDPTLYLCTSLFTQLFDVALFTSHMTQQLPPSCVMLTEIIWADKSLNTRGKRAHVKHLSGGWNYMHNSDVPWVAIWATDGTNTWWLANIGSKTPPWATTGLWYQIIKANWPVGETNRWRHKYGLGPILTQKLKVRPNFIFMHFIFTQLSDMPHTWLNSISLVGLNFICMP